MNKIIIYLLLLFTSLVFAQERYTYAIVPERYETLETNQYQINDLTVSFFKTEGFITFFNTDKFPIEIANNRCEAIFIDAKVTNSLFVTKVIIEIKDCQNNVLATSREGSSRQKEYKLAYNEAFRTALTSLKGKIKAGKTDTSKFVEKPVETQQISIKSEETTPILIENFDTNVLIAEKTANGFILKATEANNTIEIYKTTSEIVFLATRGTLQGVLIKKVNGWFFDYYSDNILVSEPIKVKF